MIKVSPNIKDIMTVDCRLIIRRIAANLGLRRGHPDYVASDERAIPICKPAL